jgi:hypothetical protein
MKDNHNDPPNISVYIPILGFLLYTPLLKPQEPCDICLAVLLIIYLVFHYNIATSQGFRNACTSDQLSLMWNSNDIHSKMCGVSAVFALLWFFLSVLLINEHKIQDGLRYG